MAALIKQIHVHVLATSNAHNFFISGQMLIKFAAN